MNNTLKASGIINKFISDNCLVVINPEKQTKIIASQFNGIEPEFKEGDYIEFSYWQKEKDGRIYNNIVEGSMVKVDMPKDITQNYSQDSKEFHTSSSPDTYINRDRLIVRQCALKCAVEHVNAYKDVNINLLKLAEEFEKWVFR